LHEALQDSGAAALREIAQEAEKLIAFLRGRHIEAGPAELWQSKGSYASARNTLDAILAEDQLLSSTGDSSGIHVMTIHKAQEFDAVILFDEPNSSPFIFQPTEAAPHTEALGYVQSRDLRLSIFVSIRPAISRFLATSASSCCHDLTRHFRGVHNTRDINPPFRPNEDARARWARSAMRLVALSASR
jgi:hypothetical protein